jgi:hypothetical protein
MVGTIIDGLLINLCYKIYQRHTRYEWTASLTFSISFKVAQLATERKLDASGDHFLGLLRISSSLASGGLPLSIISKAMMPRGRAEADSVI